MAERKKLKAIAKWSIIAMLPHLVPCPSPAQNETDRVMRAVSSERRELRECWINTAILYASKTCEAADIIIGAAFGKCVPQETKLRDAVLAQAPYMRSAIQSLMDGFRDGGRPLYVARDHG